MPAFAAGADAPEDARIERLVGVRGLSLEEARRRVAAQATDAERLALADLVVDTGGTLDETLARADALWENLAARVGGAA